MTPQEQEMIGGLIDRVQKTQLAEKDMDAEQMLQQGLGQNPDSLYILAQTVLVQKYALDQAQAQLAQAKEQIDQMQQHPEPKHATSFLGSLLGRNDAPPPPPPPAYSSQPAVYPPYAPVSGYGAGAPQYGPPPGGGGGFLQGALQTAAGVAAGALAFEGVESLMHGFGHAAGYGSEQSFGGFGGPTQRPEEVVNNYYGDDRSDRDRHEASSAERSEGDREDKDYGSEGTSGDSKEDHNSFYDAGDGTGSDDIGSGSDDSLDDNSFNDDGSDFGGDDSGGDDTNFA
jgi:uncharacterized protein